MLPWNSPSKPKFSPSYSPSAALEDGLLEPTCKCRGWNASSSVGVKQRHPSGSLLLGHKCRVCHLPVNSVPRPDLFEDVEIIGRVMAERGSMNSSSRMSAWEIMQNNALQVLYSPWAKYYYGLMVFVNVGEILATLLMPNRSTHDEWFIALEVIVVLLLVAEVILRAVAEQSKFLSSKSNVFDICVAFLCVSMLVGVLVMPSLFQLMPDWEKVAIVRIRDTLRVLRLIFLFKNHRKARLVGQNLAPVQLRMDETCTSPYDKYDDESQRPLFGDASPGFGAQPFDPSLDFGSAFSRGPSDAFARGPSIDPVLPASTFQVNIPQHSHFPSASDKV